MLKFRFTSRVGERRQVASIVVAEVVSSWGFDVQLTAQTRDGGCDIIAVSGGPVGGIELLVFTHRFERLELSPC